MRNLSICAPPIQLNNIPKIDYKAGGIKLDFDTAFAANPPGPNIVLPFTRNVLGSASFLAHAAVEALVFSNADCTGNIIANTAGAILDKVDRQPTVQVFDLVIDDTNPASPTLNMIANMEHFDAPFFTQTERCSDSVGGTENGEAENCGQLTFCVEFLSLFCGLQMDSVNVAVVVELDFQLDCSADCSFVALARDDIIEEGGDTALGFQIDCYPCSEGPGSDSLIVNQGDSIKACFSPPPIEGTCIVQILDLDFELESGATVKYDVYPSGAEADLFLTGDGYQCLDAGTNGDHGRGTLALRTTTVCFIWCHR